MANRAHRVQQAAQRFPWHLVCISTASNSPLFLLQPAWPHSGHAASGPVRQRQSGGLDQGSTALGGSLVSSSASAAAFIQLSKGASLPEAWNLHRPQLRSAVPAIGSCNWQWLPMSAAQLKSAQMLCTTRLRPPSQKRQAHLNSDRRCTSCTQNTRRRTADQATVGSLDTSNSSVLPDFPSHELRVCRKGKGDTP